MIRSLQFYSLPLKGRVGVGMGLSGGADTYSVTPTPIPTFPLKGKEKNLAAFRWLTVLSAPLRGSPNKPPALPGVI
ncbi:MAG: hypothetical protein EPN14_10015 [Gallionella sp.]|nr:MAG: hypothetical protein EPN14_10015 [Gallionella sp.]